MLAIIRSVLYYLWAGALLVPWATVAMLMSLFIKGDRLYWLCVGYLRASLWGAKHICGVDWRVQGMHHVPAVDAMTPTILCPKHQSTWETYGMPMLMSHPLAYVFKREILKIPFFGWTIARLDFIHIDRSNRAESWNKVAEQGKRLLAKGVWVIMFPEGTRTPRGSQGPYKTGAARLAVQTGAQIVPVAITSGKCWPKSSVILKPGVIDVSIGPPIASVGRDADDLMREVEAWIEAEMRRLDPEAYPSASAPV